jgi:hypothetical protein
MRLPFLSRREQSPAAQAPVIDLQTRLLRQCATTDCTAEAELQYRMSGAFAGLCGVTIYFCGECYARNLAKKAARTKPQGEQA